MKKNRLKPPIKKPARPQTPAEKWVNRLAWLDGCDVLTESYQAEEEGRKLGRLRAEIEALKAVPSLSPAWEIHLGGERDIAWLERCGKVMDRIQALPVRTDYPFEEPSELADIRAAQPKRGRIKIPRYHAGEKAFTNQLHGGVLGRFCGCLLGKPVECFDRASIRLLAETTGNWPISNYLARPNTQQMERIRKAKPRHLPKLELTGQYLGEINGMVGDDDVNYTIIGHQVVKDFGSEFTPEDVAFIWISHLPLTHTCTAERVAYRNFLAGVLPPLSATTRNPYREWIGAMIRADYFGYANPGDPARAAQWAWRDASISHVRNGIYGEMFVAAMLAAAYVFQDWPSVIRAGLDQIPAKCRLRRDIETMLDLHRQGAGWEQACDIIHAQWNELLNHFWCHTNSNAMVVVMALLWGEDDYEKTITRAVMAGFDTDCNGATCGSLWGIMHGADAIPKKWAEPLKDSGVSSLPGWQRYSIRELAEAMASNATKHGARTGV